MPKPKTGRKNLMRSVGSQDAEEEISIPEELFPYILRNMPGHRVFEFRCLSKHYKEMIDDDDFIHIHYAESIRLRPHIVLHQSIRRDKNSFESEVFHLDFGLLGNCKVNTFEPPFKYNKDNELRFLGCRRGILCYYVNVGDPARIMFKDYNHFVFWNPLTGAVGRSRRAIKYHKYTCERFFFGHDEEYDNLKVLKITNMDCMIYSSRGDYWRGIQGFDNLMRHQGNMLCTFNWTSPEVFVEDTNCIHMIVYTKGEYPSPRVTKVLAFNFNSEKFSLVPLPKTTSRFTSLYLSTVNGHLCLICWPKPNHNLEVWIMKEYVIEQSWTSLLSIHRDSIPSLPIGLAVINARPQLLMFSSNGTSKSRLYLYDIHRKQLNDTQVDFDKMSVPQHFLFAPSLHLRPYWSGEWW